MAVAGADAVVSSVDEIGFGEDRVASLARITFSPSSEEPRTGVTAMVGGEPPTSIANHVGRAVVASQ